MIRRWLTLMIIGAVLSGCSGWNRYCPPEKAERARVEAELHFRAAMERTPGPATRDYNLYRGLRNGK
jgi:hypothetical protein